MLSYPIWFSVTSWRNRAINTQGNQLSAGEWIFLLLVFVAMTVALYGVFQYAPTEKTMGDMQRIFYFHVASAWVAFFAFFVACVCSIAYLATRRLYWDRRALGSAELGVLFCSLVLITGPIWAKGAWGIFWTWDARLTTTLVLWLIYVGYLMLRSLVQETSKQATLCAVLAIVGFVDVPIVYMSIRWWRTQHPQPVMMGGEGSGLDPAMRLVFFFCLLTFTLLFFYLLRKRLRLAQAEDAIDEMHRQLQQGF